MKKGICIIASGSPYYGAWALNLAMGLKFTDPETKICLLWSQNALNRIKEHIHNFDILKEIPSEYYMTDQGENHLRTKVYLNELTPFDETIFIDADVIWYPYKKAADLFEELKDIDFTIGCRSMNTLDSDPRLIWANKEEYEKYANEIYNLSSEFIYFKKTQSVNDFFTIAQIAFDNPQIEFKRFAGGVPDELAFQIAMTQTEIKPHKVPFLPFYWESFERKNLHIPEIYNSGHYGYSIGGNKLTPVMTTIYNNLVKFYSQKFGVVHYHLCKNKSDLFVNRKHI